MDPSSSARPLRVAGLALLGVAAAALVAGTVSLIGGEAGPEDGGQAAPPVNTTTVTGPGTEPGAPPGSTQPEQPAPTGPEGTPDTSGESPTAPPGAVTDQPGTGQPGQPVSTGEYTLPAGQGSGTVRPSVRVYNNGTITGLASRAAEELRSAGWQVDEVGNYSAGRIPTSTVYYRPGTEEQAAAEELGQLFHLRTAPRFEGIAGASPGLIVIITNDYRGPGSK